MTRKNNYAVQLKRAKRTRYQKKQTWLTGVQKEAEKKVKSMSSL